MLLFKIIILWCLGPILITRQFDYKQQNQLLLFLHGKLYFHSTSVVPLDV